MLDDNLAHLDKSTCLVSIIPHCTGAMEVGPLRPQRVRRDIEAGWLADTYVDNNNHLGICPPLYTDWWFGTLFDSLSLFFFLHVKPTTRLGGYPQQPTGKAK